MLFWLFWAVLLWGLFSGGKWGLLSCHIWASHFGQNTGSRAGLRGYGIFLDQGLNPFLLHWQTDSLPPSHQASPAPFFIIRSLTLNQWTWIWENSGRSWKNEEPGVLHSLGSQRVGHDLVTGQQLLYWYCIWRKFLTDSTLVGSYFCICKYLSFNWGYLHHLHLR